MLPEGNSLTGGEVSRYRLERTKKYAAKFFKRVQGGVVHEKEIGNSLLVCVYSD
jgi:hypothetical protein